jgi:hypothetical protein
MSEELLEILKRVESNLEHHYPENLRDFHILKQAVIKFNAIKEGNSKKALDCLSCLGNFIDGHCTGTTAEDDVHLIECFDTIEQALMKSQEQKKYLKWEDLETETGCSRVDLDVSLNGAEYRLSYFQNDALKLLTNDEDFYLEIEDKQFFDNLHLERIEENE